MRLHPSCTANKILIYLGLTYLTKLCVVVSHSQEHKFCPSSRNSVNPICGCGNVMESLKRNLHCSNFEHERVPVAK